MLYNVGKGSVDMYSIYIYRHILVSAHCKYSFVETATVQYVWALSSSKEVKLLIFRSCFS